MKLSNFASAVIQYRLKLNADYNRKTIREREKKKGPKRNSVRKNNAYIVLMHFQLLKLL